MEEETRRQGDKENGENEESADTALLAVFSPPLDTAGSGKNVAGGVPALSLLLPSALPMTASLECLLFVAGEPVPLSDLARALERDENETEAALRDLQIHLRERDSGLQLLRIAGGWQFATRPEYAPVVARMLARGANKLSRAAMETLAIVAYRQPVTAPEIEAVRGVSVSGVLKTLLERRLITEAGRKAALGRPMLYVTTPDFLHYFAIADISQLPPLEADAPIPPPVSAESVTDGRSIPISADIPPLVLSSEADEE